jgi:hypothetical protein
MNQFNFPPKIVLIRKIKLHHVLDQWVHKKKLLHGFTDVMISLYVTVQRYEGNVHLVVTNMASWCLVKYNMLIHGLSRHATLRPRQG